MATGYTWNVMEGNTSARDFMLHCAQAFGAMIEFRDENTVDWENVIATLERRRNEEVARWTKKCREADAELERLESMTDTDFQRQWDREKAEEERRYRERMKETTAHNINLRKVMAVIEEWEPPTSEHVEYRDFMLRQLEESLEKPFRLDPPTSLEEYKAAKLEHATWGAQYAHEQLEKCNERLEGHIQWVKAMLESLPKE